MNKENRRISYAQVPYEGWGSNKEHNCSGGLCAHRIMMGDQVFMVGELFNLKADAAMCCSKECLKNLALNWDMADRDILGAIERGMDA